MEKLEKSHSVEEIKEVEPDLVLLYTTRSMIYADFLKEGLEKAKIPCLVKSEVGIFPRIISHPLKDIKICIPKNFWQEGEEIEKMLLNNLE